MLNAAICHSKSNWPLTMSALLSALLLAIGLSGPGFAGDKMAGRVHVSQPWAPATPKGARVGVGYMLIHNMGTKPDRLMSGQSEVAGRIEFHQMKVSNGIMWMRHLSDGLEIPPGKSVELRPGGHHIMFKKLKKPIIDGGKFKATFVFEQAGRVDLEFSAKSIGYRGDQKPNAHGGHGQMKHSTK